VERLERPRQSGTITAKFILKNCRAKVLYYWQMTFHLPINL